MRTFTHAALCSLGLASALCAQTPVSLVGTLIPVPGGHSIEEFHDPSILVQAAVDLTELELEPVVLEGAFLDAQTLQASAIAMSEDGFRTPEDAPVGSSVEFRLDVAALSEFYVYVSVGAGFMPLSSYGPTVFGSLWLDPSVVFTWQSGMTSSRWRQSFVVPNDPAMVGLNLVFQAAIRQPSGPLTFLNAGGMSLLP